MKTETTRRALLGGAGIAGVVLIAPAVGSATSATTTPDRRAWDAALSKYRAARASSDVCPPDDPHEDELVDDYCAAMDMLIIDTPAPDLTAVLHKLDLISERMVGMVYDDDYPNAIRADLRRIGGEN